MKKTAIQRGQYGEIQNKDIQEEPTTNESLVDALRKILEIRFAEYPDGDESAPFKIITRMQRIARNALKNQQTAKGKR